MPGSYYDLDDFLAEEEVVQCQTKFDFSHLSHLDPDAMFSSMNQNSNSNNNHHQHYHVLPEGSKITIPLWAVRKWADLGFCRIALPIPYRRKAREMIQADPASVSLQEQKSNCITNGNGYGGSSGCYYRTGHTILQVIESSSRNQVQILYTLPSNMERNVQLQLLEKDLQEAQQLRETLLQTYTGARFNQTLDWALSSVGDDVTAFIHKLTDMEKRLYYYAAIAATNHQLWKLNGNNHHRNRRRGITKKPTLQPPQPKSLSSSNQNKKSTLRTVTPTIDHNHHGDGRPRQEKRMKM